MSCIAAAKSVGEKLQAIVSIVKGKRGRPASGLELNGIRPNFDDQATILIIDDQASIRALLRFALESSGYEVTEAANGREGLALSRRRPMQLVITDIVMPEMDGLKMLLELTREFLHAKVIAISGAGWKHDALDVAKLLGAWQAFQKPLNIP